MNHEIKSVGTTEVVIRSKDELRKELFEAAEPVLSRNQRNAEEILAAVSSQLQAVMNIAQAQSLADAYQTVDNVVLQQGKDGNYSATLRDDKGRIVEQVPLKKASSRLTTAIKEGFAVNCAIAGQAQMMQVAKRLEEIRESLTEQKDRDACEKINAVECAMMSFQDAVTVSEDFSARLVLVMTSRDHLRKALSDAYSFMEEQVKRIPIETAGAGFFENWGSGKTKSEKAEEYFRYFIRLIPAYCRGISMLAMTDAYVDADAEMGAIVFAKRFMDLFAKYDIQRRMMLVPTICGKDPERMMSAIAQGIDAAVRQLELHDQELAAGQVELVIPLKKGV